nr:NAD(P)H-dependent glycerol-3-phosphate dehydrogenase [Ameyamaea chiangmaiensis]
MSIGVIGAGAWGTALALHAARGGAHVRLWSRDPLRPDADGANPRLPGFALPPSVVPTTTLPDRTDLLLVTTPVQHLRATLGGIAGSAPLVLCCKGVERATGALPMQVAAEVLPGRPCAVLSGPNFAHEVAAGLPAAASLAATDGGLAEAIAGRVSGPALRLYPSTDPLGVQIGGAAKNVIAIAAGVTIGARLGENARAALITRAIVEMGRLADAMGGRPDTLAGLSGLGDLILTCTGPSSRNFSLGLALGEGVPLADILARRSSVTEGVETAPALLALARRHQIEVPIIAMVTRLLAGELTPQQARDALMSRPTRGE